MSCICPKCGNSGRGFEGVVKGGVITHMQICIGTKHFYCDFTFHPEQSHLYCEKIVRQWNDESDCEVLIFPRSEKQIKEAKRYCIQKCTYWGCRTGPQKYGEVIDPNGVLLRAGEKI